MSIQQIICKTIGHKWLLKVIIPQVSWTESTIILQQKMHYECKRCHKQRNLSFEEQESVYLAYKLNFENVLKVLHGEKHNEKTNTT